MNKAHIAIHKIVSKELTVTEAADLYGYSRRHLHRLLSRYRNDGLDGLKPQSKRPHTNPRAIPKTVHNRIIELRKHLTAHGFDAGPVTIAWHLEQEGLMVPAASTIHRLLREAGLVTANPKKRPRSSFIRFEANWPNETWQSDFTYWRLADGSDVHILNWLDDHSRALLSSTVYPTVDGAAVVHTFLTAIEQFGPPQSTLTDNGFVYTARLAGRGRTGGRNEFEYLLTSFGIKQKNGAPYHPQTQGKIERFHQTLKKHLRQLPHAQNISELQAQIDTFRTYYNEHRPHAALARRTPMQAYQATEKAVPAKHFDDRTYRERHDIVDRFGKISLRRSGKMHHLTHRG